MNDKDRFLKWLKRSHWHPCGLAEMLTWNEDQKSFNKPEIQSMFTAWKAGRRSK